MITQSKSLTLKTKRLSIHFSEYIKVRCLVRQLLIDYQFLDCIRGLAWLAGGRYIVSSSEDKKSKIVDVTAKKVLDSLPHTQTSNEA